MEVAPAFPNRSIATVDMSIEGTPTSNMMAAALRIRFIS